MAYRSPARWLAPLAIAGAVGAILLTIQSTRGSGSSTTAGTSSSSTVTGSSTGTTRHSSKRFYVVRDGDVLSGIAGRTGVPLTRIERLNPNVDAQSLHAGQKIKLAP